MMLSHLRRRKARPGKSGEVAIRVLLEVGLKILAPIAVLHLIPESGIESLRGGLVPRRRRLKARRRERGCIQQASEAKVPSG